MPEPTIKYGTPKSDPTAARAMAYIDEIQTLLEPLLGGPMSAKDISCIAAALITYGGYLQGMMHAQGGVSLPFDEQAAAALATNISQGMMKGREVCGQGQGHA